MLVASQNEVVRGQYGYGPPPAHQPGCISRSFQWMGQHPWITAGVVATAIAVPVAIAASDDDAS
jgi:hypothetical protein